ncbi:reverse transcriptase domain-containing protein [Trichonephila clavipes]|nr:reverse transcriptase domain-containing protein [Trichonephila clavipes]
MDAFHAVFGLLRFEMFADDIVPWFSDPEFTSHKHIEYLVLKNRKRLNILKYIAGKNWRDDAATLRITYFTLIRPILECGFLIYSCASNSAQKKSEKVQLSAARIITALRHSCFSNIVLFEEDLRPLLLRRQAGLVKYTAGHRKCNTLKEEYK